MSDAVYLVRQGEEFAIFDLPKPGMVLEIAQFDIEIECQQILSAAPKGKGRSVEKGTGRPADKPKPGKPDKSAGVKRGPGRPKKVKDEDKVEDDPLNGEPEVPEEEIEEQIPTFPPAQPFPVDVPAPVVPVVEPGKPDAGSL